MNVEEPKKKRGTRRKTKQEEKEEEIPKVVPKVEAVIKDAGKVSKQPKDKKPKKTASKEVKAEKEVDDKRPKRAWPAFFFFQKDKRAEVKETHPELAQKEIVAVSSRFHKSIVSLFIL